MKLLTGESGGTPVAGILDGDNLVVCAEGAAAQNAVLAVIEGGPAALADWAEKSNGDARRIPLVQVTVMAPIPRPTRDIFCVGKNYVAHALEVKNSGMSGGVDEVPTEPIIFTKATTAVCGPGDVVNGSLDPTETVDYEGELGVIIGKRAFQVSKGAAFDYVFGYVIINDVTSRALQKRHKQWVIGKGLDTFCPMGPYIATADEIADVTALTVHTEINGEVRQDGSTGDMIFDIPTLIETLTQTMTLIPGDIIATGTPAGVGIGFQPPKFLKKGDKMAISITGLGTLENTIG
ncbi:MAG: fumarylacetoacetate hydrolase family protein [Magnetospiraceae bacterium]